MRECLYIRQPVSPQTELNFAQTSLHMHRLLASMCLKKEKENIYYKVPSSFDFGICHPPLTTFVFISRSAYVANLTVFKKTFLWNFME